MSAMLWLLSNLAAGVIPVPDPAIQEAFCFDGACMCSRCSFEPPVACEKLQPPSAAGASADAWNRYDVCAFYEPEHGIVRVSEERWAAAQEHERRNLERSFSSQEIASLLRTHIAFRSGYRSLHRRVYSGELRLGRILELGGGPYPQVRRLLQQFGAETAESLTIVDPLVSSYASLVESRYQGGKLEGFPSLPLHLFPMPAEAFNQSNRPFDTVIIVDVLRHAISAPRVLDVLLRHVVIGGGSESWLNSC